MGYEIINSGTTRRPLSYDGLTRSHDSQTKSAKIVNVIPISLVYQIDVYARLAEEADILMRNLVFNIVNYPAITIDATAGSANNFFIISSFTDKVNIC